MTSRRLSYRVRTGLLLAAGLGVLGVGAYLAGTNHPGRPAARQVQAVAEPASASPTATPLAQSSTSPSLTPTASSHPVVAGAATTAPKPVAAPAHPATPQPPTPVATALLTLSEPDGITAYTIDLAHVTNACDILTAAHAQGKLRSVTLDSAYFSTLHSTYVREINGYANNWTVKVNGASPKGCSLATVTKGDSVVWTYQ